MPTPSRAAHRGRREPVTRCVAALRCGHDLEDAIAELDAALNGHDLEDAYRVVRRHARRTRRVSATGERDGDVLRDTEEPRQRLDALFPVLPVELYERVRVIRDHLVAMRDALRTGREDDETKPRLDLEDP